MRMRPEKEFLFTEIQPISLKSKFKLACFLKFYQWILKTLNIKEVTSLKKICMWNKKVIICQKKEPVEWQFLRQQKTLSVGLCSVTTTWIEWPTYYNLKNVLIKIKLLSIKMNWMTKSLYLIVIQLQLNQLNSTRFKPIVSLEDKSVNLFSIF